MIKLNLHIGSGDAIISDFFTIDELLKYLDTFSKYEVVWLLTKDCENGDIFITKNFDTLTEIVKINILNVLWDSPCNIYLQEYQSFKDAYEVAISMKEDETT